LIKPQMHADKHRWGFLRLGVSFLIYWCLLPHLILLDRAEVIPGVGAGLLRLSVGDKIDRGYSLGGGGFIKVICGWQNWSV